MSNEFSKPAEPTHLLPHQAEMVERVVNARTPARFLLSSPPGAGKSFAMAALAGALRARSEASRCLVIVPAPFLLMWQEDLRRFGSTDSLVMTPQTYRRLQAETTKDSNVWSTGPSVVASIDFLKSSARLEEALTARWDLILIDEIQICSATNQRGEAAKRIWNDPVVPLVVAATRTPDRLEWLLQDTTTQQILWSYGDLAQHLRLPRRRVELVNYSPTDVERDISTRIFEIVRNAPKIPQGDFVGQILLRRLNSSMYALEQSVRNLLLRDTYLEQSDEDDEVKLEGIIKSLISKEVGIDREAVEQIIALLEAGSRDSKWDCCEQLLKQHGLGETCSAVIFTDFADTARYLEYLATSRGLKPFVISGSSSSDQRQQSLEAARNVSSVLIATAAVEGLVFDFTNQVIHYDLPWEPLSFLQRCGRVERLGSRFEEIHHYCLLAAEPDANAKVKRLLNDVEELEAAWR